MNIFNIFGRRSNDNNGEDLRILISYRRDDSQFATDRIYERLAKEFGHKQIVRDLDNIPPGVDFRKSIDDAINYCTVALVIIGPTWASISDNAGRRRLEDARDFVRLEVESILARNMTVIPVTIGGTKLPSA